MRTLLAEQLLARVMNYDIQQLADVRASLQSFASFKFDEYEQYSPGQRYIEQLALWLEQFSPDERQMALAFAQNSVVFHTRQEMQHLVSMAFPDCIRPHLLRQTGAQLGLPWYCVGRIAKSPEFEIATRRSLFLGLSDGAHIDVFRRSNPQLSNEQVWLTYDVSQAKGVDFKKKLRDDLAVMLNRDPNESETTFTSVFLLDDFSGSGFSYIREDDGKIAGKIKKIQDKLESELSEIVAPDASIMIVLYLATERARRHIETLMSRLSRFNGASLQVVQLLPASFIVDKRREPGFYEIAMRDRYYVADYEDKHTAVGGTKDVRLGFSECALPLVLSHNTPNNSVFLLWSPSDKVLGLFPRVSRH